MSWKMTEKEKLFRQKTRQTIGDNIRAIRKDRGMTQIELAERIDKSEAQIVAWERGKTDIKVADALILLDVLKSKLTLDELAGNKK